MKNSYQKMKLASKASVCESIICLSPIVGTFLLVHTKPYWDWALLCRTGLLYLSNSNIVKLRQGSGKERQRMALKAKGLKA